jgi:fatty-acyl-CoA synthase
MNVGAWVTRWANLRPQKAALIHEGQVFTYLKLNERINRLANLFFRLNLRKGDRVGVLLNNCHQYMEAFLALSKIGGLLVPLNTRLAELELTYILKDSGASILVFGDEFTDLTKSMKKHDLGVKAYLCVGTPPSWGLDYEKAIGEVSSREPEPSKAVGGEDPHLIMYTSGTTGLPKGAVLSHRKTFFNALNADIYYGLIPDDVVLISRALFHSGGLLVEAAPILYKGGTMVMKKRFRPSEILETVERHRVSVLEAPATLFKFILEQCDLRAYDLSSLKCCFTGGERVPPSLLKDYQERGITLSQIYGQTETSTITWLPVKEASRKLGSVGIPVFHGDVRVVDKQGSRVKAGEIGEIVVGGYITMNGYWGKPDLTAETIREGWLHTGDLATVDEDGFVYIVDREKDMFISGGENVYPAEVEKLYLEHPKILNAAVVGVPDEKWGEVGAVFIVLKEGENMTEEEALRFCDGRIARYKMPKHVRFAKDLPMTAAQKIMRNRLRQAYLEALERTPSQG